MAAASMPAALLHKKAVSLMKANGLNTLSVLEEQGEDSGPSVPAATKLAYLTQKGTPATDTLRVCAVYGRRHDTVLRAYDNLTCEAEFRQRNFVEATYTDRQG
jgi:hypothetical protein